MVTCLDETRHSFQDGDYVTFTEIQGMTELNRCEPRKVKVLGESTRALVFTALSLITKLSPGTLGLLSLPTCGAGSVETVRCPSVCLSHSPAAAAYDEFAAVGPAGRRYQLIAASPAPQQHGAAAQHAATDAGSVSFLACVCS